MAKPTQVHDDHPKRNDLQAAPPDDGGHQGSYTRPQDMLVEPEPQARDAQAPMLQYTNDFPRGRSRAPVLGFWLVIALIVITVVLMLWAY